MLNFFAWIIQSALLTLPLQSYKEKQVWIKACESAETTNITGYWEGTITQDYPGGKRVDYPMEVNFTQKGKTVTGVAIVRHLQYSAKMNVEGKVKGKGTYFQFEEDKIIKFDQIPQAEWCYKKYVLIYRRKGTEETLEGVWEAKTAAFGPCDPGRILLTKKVPRV